MKRFFIILSVLVCILIQHPSIAIKKPVKTSLELQAIQSKTYDAPKSITFPAVLSVFQDMGYIIKSADIVTGFIMAVSPNKNGYSFWVGGTMNATAANVFIEDLTEKQSKVRLNFLNSKQYTALRVGPKETPVEDPQVYQNAFSKIDEAVFYRLSLKKLQTEQTAP